MNRNRWIFALVILLVSSLACSIFTGGAKAPATVAPTTNSDGGIDAIETVPPAEGNKMEATATSAEKDPGSYQTEFPLPENVSNFTDMGNGAINFQTKMSLKDAIAFYREEFATAGYKERQINTVISDTTFSMVFDGHVNGKDIVIQGVDMGGGSTNINIRFDDV